MNWSTVMLLSMHCQAALRRKKMSTIALHAIGKYFAEHSQGLDMMSGFAMVSEADRRRLRTVEGHEGTAINGAAHPVKCREKGIEWHTGMFTLGMTIQLDSHTTGAADGVLWHGEG